MELSQKYVYKIYQTKSFSKASKELYISQPSLSSTVKKLESELGFTIFDRSKTPLTVTPEGAIYIEYIEKIMENESEMKYRINNLTDFAVEKFGVGGGDYISRLVLPKACSELNKAFPNIGIKIDMSSRSILDQKIESGELDCMIAYIFDDRRFSGVPFFKENYYLAMRKDLPGAQSFIEFASDRTRVLSGEALSCHKFDNWDIADNIRLLYIGRPSSVFTHLHNYMEQFDYANCSVANARSMGFYYDLMAEGLGAVITTDFVIGTKPFRDDIIYIPINAANNTRCAHIIYKKHTYLSSATKKFIEIMTEMGRTKSFLNI